MLHRPVKRDPGLDRGVENIVQRCLCVTRGERVALVHWKSPELVGVFEEALRSAGADVTRTDLGARSSVLPGTSASLSSAFEGRSASLLVAAQEFPMPLSFAVREAARNAKLRHLHLAGLDARVLSQSARAEPERLFAIGARVADAITTAGALMTHSDAGTALEVRASRAFPLLIGTGRPEPGNAENVPAGFVYWHPPEVRGVFVADRGVALTGHRINTRRSPVRVVIESSRVRSVECADPETLARIDEYLASHPNAGRVGTAVFPTNYLVRSEIGVHAQDELSPGLNVNLGFSHAAVSRAPWDAPVQLRLLARRLTVRAGDRSLVENGRHAEDLVEGADPFR